MGALGVSADFTKRPRGLERRIEATAAAGSVVDGIMGSKVHTELSVIIIPSRKAGCDVR